MTLRRFLIGTQPARTWVGILAIGVPIVASLAFFAGVDLVLTLWLLYVALAIAMYAGWSRAGFLAGGGAVFLTVFWRFVFPPLIGYYYQSMDTRYTPPRVLGYKLDPRGELVEGLTNGPLYAVGGALLLGATAYLIGIFVHQTATYVTD